MNIKDLPMAAPFHWNDLDGGETTEKARRRRKQFELPEFEHNTPDVQRKLDEMEAEGRPII